jgi:hypothetical protein
VTHRALVAFPSENHSETRYDVYFSKNGAEDLILKPVLEEFVESGDQDLANLPQYKGSAIETLESFPDFEATDESGLIDDEPVQKDLPRDTLGDVVNYVFHEALFICDDGVDVYQPVFLCPNVLRPFRNHVSLFAERRANLPNNPRQITDLPNRGTSIEISSAEFQNLDLEPDSRGERAPEVQILIEALGGLLQNIYTSKREASTYEEASAQLWLDEWVVVSEITDLRGLDLWASEGSGLLVGFEDETQQHSELVDVFHDTRRTANELLLLASLDSSVSNPSRETDIQALGGLLEDVLRTFNYDISTLSPSPFPELVEKL